MYDKQQQTSGPGGSFGYSTGGRRAARGGAYFPTSFVWSHQHRLYFFILIKRKKSFSSVQQRMNDDEFVDEQVIL